jgi:hypothetical protein
MVWLLAQIAKLAWCMFSKSSSSKSALSFWYKLIYHGTLIYYWCTACGIWLLMLGKGFLMWDLVGFLILDVRFAWIACRSTKVAAIRNLECYAVSLLVRIWL